MRVGIRTKMVVLLMAVATVPLVAALMTIVLGGRKLQTEAVGDTLRAVTTAQAHTLHVSLTAEIEKLDSLLNGSQVIVKMLSARKEAPSEARVKQYEARWPNMPETVEPLRSILNNPVAQRIRLYSAYREQYLGIVEILVTDRFGYLVAATGKSEDYAQGDERWWQRAYGEGKGRVYVGEIMRDPSADVRALSFSVPIRSNGEVVGIAKIVMEADRWVGIVSPDVVNKPVTAVLVRRGGTGRLAYLRSEGKSPPKTIEWQMAADATGPGWRVTDDGHVQAYAPLDMPEQIGTELVEAPRWVLLLQMSESAAMADVYDVTTVGLGIGLGLIGALFVMALALVDRSIVRRIRRLERATRLVSQGDLTHRIGPQGKGGYRLLGTDEINDLVDDFNRMVQRVQESHQALEDANEMKTNFIRVAGHELRTPVSYMLAMEHLTRRSNDPEDLQRALAAMTAKAERLDEIIQALFKLLPMQRYVEELRYSDVSLPDLVEEIGLAISPFVQQRAQTLIAEVPSDLPRVPADRDKLYDVIENLLMNAVKFTPDEGQVEISARLQLGGYVAIRVTDQGPGIPEQELPHIFESFYSGGSVMTHSTGASGYQKRGLGLGLAIVKHFVELHGGDVHVQSSDDGSVFTVTLPMEPPAQAIRPQEPPKA